MRTTLTLDDDVIAKLKTCAAEEKDRSFKEIVNDTLRLGLEARKKVNRPGKFKVRAKSLGMFPHLNYDNISELLEQAEGPEHR